MTLANRLIGRTTVSGTVNVGSNPALPANYPSLVKWKSRQSSELKLRVRLL